MRLLIDTNVYLEYFLKRDRFDAVRKFFHEAIERKYQTCITAMSLRDIGYIVHKYTHDKDLTRKIQVNAYCMTSKVISTSDSAAIESLYSDIDDYEDSLQSYAAELAMCVAIITWNKKDFKGSRVPVYTPEEIYHIWISSK